MHTALVKIDVAAVDLRRSIRRIEQMVDGGTPDQSGLLWVFNLAINPAGRRRDLRFWRPELLALAGVNTVETNRMEIGEVIAEILPASRAHFHAGEVDQMFQIRPNTRIDFGKEMSGKLAGGRNVYLRATLETFLNHRWIGRMAGVAK